jgi:hypothetical protein
MGNMVAAAERYIEHGFSLIPVSGKEPHYKVLERVSGSPKWGRYRDTPADLAEVGRWLACDPDAGLAVLTGSASGIVVADFDTLECPDIETPTVRSARGAHLYLSMDDRRKTARRPWGDLKGDGGYVVAPPSRHPSGRQYRWETGRALGEVDLLKVSDVGAWLDASVPRAGTSSTTTSTAGVNTILLS